jgi:hypothetical protein
MSQSSDEVCQRAGFPNRAKQSLPDLCERMRHNSAQAVILLPADVPLVAVRYDGWCPHLTGNPASLRWFGDILFRLL